MLSIYLAFIDNEENKKKASHIYELYYYMMIHTAKSILIEHMAAEDAVAESMIKIMKNLNKIKDVFSYETKGYIAIIVRNTALDMLRSQKNITIEPIEDFELPDEDNSILDELTIKDACSAIVKCIRVLPQTLSDVLYLSVVLDHSNEEISKLLEISRDAVKMRLSRAKKEVRKLLRKEGFDYEG